MSTIETRIKDAAEKAVLQLITQGAWLQIDYKDRISIPADFLKEAYALVDRASLRKKLTDRVESELADRLVNHLATEMATDIKQILSVPERREAIRALARDHLDSIMKLGATK